MTTLRPLAAFPALRSPNFRLFLGGQTVSLIGTWLQTVAHGWLVLELTDSAYTVGLVSMLGSLPILLFTLYGGVIADRVDKRRWIVRLQALMLLEALALAVLTSTGQVTVAWVMALAALFGLLTAFEVPLRQSLFAELVPKADLVNAIALNSAAYNVARVVGPAIAGVTIGTLGTAACFYLNAASYVAVLWSLRRLDLPAHTSARDDGRALDRLAEGLRFLRDEAWPRTMILLTLVLALGTYPFLTMLPVFARQALGLAADGYGFITAITGLGAAVAAVGIAWAGDRLRQGPVAAVAAVLLGAVLLGTAAAPSPAWATPLLFLAGGLAAATGIATNTFLQRAVPDGLRGRIMGVYSFVVLGMMPFGSVQAGWIAEQQGVRASFALGGITAAVAGAAVLLRRRPSPTA